MQRWILAATGLFALGLSISAAADELKVGDAAPEFEMVGTDGKTYKLSDFKGKQAVVLAWYPRAATPGCTKECKSFKTQGAEMRKFDVAYFTASCDPVQKNKDFAASLDLDYPILSDPDASVAVKYGLTTPEKKTASRTTFIIGADGKILDIERKVNTENHGADIAKKLAELKIPAAK